MGDGGEFGLPVVAVGVALGVRLFDSGGQDWVGLGVEVVQGLEDEGVEFVGGEPGRGAAGLFAVAGAGEAGVVAVAAGPAVG